MEKVKPYLVPIIAVVVLLVWFFVIKPQLSADAGGAAPDGDAEGTSAGQDAKAGAGAKQDEAR